jgi:hypothetical protein
VFCLQRVSCFDSQHKISSTTSFIFSSQKVYTKSDNMGMTNIHHASQILQRAGTKMTDQAQIMPLGKPVLLVGRSFTLEEIETFSEALQTSHRDKWVEYNGTGPPRPTTNDKGLPVPTLYTTIGLKEQMATHGRLDHPTNINREPIELAFVIVVRGASAALFSKVRVFYSHFAVAAGIMEEALSSWSVVFSAAMLKQDALRLGREPVSFEKVESLQALIAAAEEKKAANTVLLCC